MARGSFAKDGSVKAIVELQKDSVVRLAKAVNASGFVHLDDYLWIIPVKINKSAVETRFLARRTTDILRSTAQKTGLPPLPLVGPDLLAPFSNLKLTLRPEESVRVRERDAETDLDNIVLELLEIKRRQVVISLSIPSEIVVDLRQLNPEQELNLHEILDKLNHGDVRERVDDL
jgi:hypothetical protein